MYSLTWRTPCSRIPNCNGVSYYLWRRWFRGLWAAGSMVKLAKFWLPRWRTCGASVANVRAGSHGPRVTWALYLLSRRCHVHPHPARFTSLAHTAQTETPSYWSKRDNQHVTRQQGRLWHCFPLVSSWQLPIQCFMHISPHTDHNSILVRKITPVDDLLLHAFGRMHLCSQIGIIR